IQSSSPVGMATDVYGGRSFQEAVLAARTSRADFRIVSGGLGLVRGDDAIPSYSLSLVRQSSDFIGSRVAGGGFDARKWVAQVQRGPGAAPLSELLRTAPDAIAVVGISNAYLSLVGEDLETLSPSSLERVRLIGMGIRNACPLQLQNYILPYD